MRFKRSMLIFFGLYCAFLVLIFHHGCTIGRQRAVPEATVREFLTLTICAENQRIEQYLLLLEMLDRGDVASAKKRLQELLYILIMVPPEPPEWEATDEPEFLKEERLRLLRRIKAYHEKHKHEIDMTLPSNRAAVRHLEKIE